MTTAIGTYATRTLVTPRLGGTFDSTENTLLDGLCDQVNQEIETVTSRVLAPITSATYLFDGNDLRWLSYPKGIRAITSLEIAPVTGGTFVTLAAGDYKLRPLAQDRRPGWPATQVMLSDIPAGDYTTFPVGVENVRIVMTTSFAAIPDDVIRIAIDAVVRAWDARQIGQSEASDTGSPIPTHFLSRRERELLDIYRARPALY